MKHIKDFLYNWNDLVVILIILAAAGGLIYWRVSNIMDYPRVLASEISEGTAEGLDIPMPEEELKTEVEETITGDIVPGAGPADSDIWTKSRLYSNVTMGIPEGTEDEMVKALVDGGLFASYDDFVAVCENANVDHTKIAAGNYTFTAGSTQQDIAKQVTVREVEKTEETTEENTAETTEGSEEVEATSDQADTSDTSSEEVTEEVATEEYVEEGGGEEWVEEETTDEG